MAEPQDITRNPNLSVVRLEWAESGAAVEPSLGRKATGEQPADLYTSNEHNWLGREPMRWLRALFSRYLSASDSLSSSWFVQKGAQPPGVWSTDGVGVLEGFLSDSPTGTSSLVADVWLDPTNDGSGVRMQVSVTKASPHTFLATRDHYIFAPVDVIVPPTISDPELTYLDVVVGNPQPATPAGTVPVWRVETDGATIVDQEILLQTFPILTKVGFLDLQAAMAQIAGDLDLGGNLTVDGDTILGDAAGDTLTVNSTGTFLELVTCDDGIQGLAASPLTLTEGATIAASKTVIGDATTGITTGQLTSLAFVEAGSGFQGIGGGTPDLPQGAAVPVGKNITVGGTITTETLVPERTDYPTSADSIVAGRATYNGRRLAIGDGTNTRRIDSPVSVYVVSETTVNAIDDLSGASITMDIGDDEFVFFEVNAIQSVLLSGNNPLLQLAATNGVDVVAMLNFGDGDQARVILPPQAFNGDARPNSLIVRWKPSTDIPGPDNTTWTVRVRHGVTGSTLTTSRVYYRAWYD